MLYMSVVTVFKHCDLIKKKPTGIETILIHLRFGASFTLTKCLHKVAVKVTCTICGSQQQSANICHFQKQGEEDIILSAGLKG